MSDNKTAIEALVNKSSELGKLIASRKLADCDKLIKDMIDRFGHSNFLLRKSLLIHCINENGELLPQIEAIMDEAGIGSNNFIASSTLRCYEEEQNTLSLKRSVMNLVDKGKANRFTRDLSRISFHPHAADLDELGEMIQSCLQSSLIDALIIIKVNQGLIEKQRHQDLFIFFDAWDKLNIPIDDIASIYIDFEFGESLFYKHSSAWLENADVVKYRVVQDHFYDDPASSYFRLEDILLARVGNWIASIELEDLAEKFPLTTHGHVKLQELEAKGHITRSSAFNYLTLIKNGHASISERSLYSLMGRTHDLAKTTNILHLKNLAKYADSPWSQLVYYLLIAKRSANEVDDHRLRKLIEYLVQTYHRGDLLSFVNGVHQRSEAVAIFAYEVFTADFISKLTRLIKSSAQITEARAALHRWMGNISGEQRYLDRARTLIIDHKINLVRNELDDHRIYVDAARFDEWINDELMRDLSMVFTSMLHNSNFANGEDALILQAIEKAYFSFCSNNKFGIASYLGRRIRHGTFKGHLYSGVISIENHPKYSRLFQDAQLNLRWQQWKADYERKIDSIISSRLHIESNSKRDGLLKPTIKGSGKQEIAIACAKSLVKHFAEHKTTIGIPLILTEYCWRIAEIDLRNSSNYLKSQKAALIMQDSLAELYISQSNKDLAKEFNRELVHLVNEKLKVMYGWFKKPLSVAPKASLSLLYRAVVAEVQLAFPNFKADTEYEENEDIEIMGGAYHVLYDAFYVVVYNAAKHGKEGGSVERSFKIQKSEAGVSGHIVVILSSAIKDHECEQETNERLLVRLGDDIENAQLSEDRSGIRKLHQLQRADRNFELTSVECRGRKVHAVMSYRLEHL